MSTIDSEVLEVLRGRPDLLPVATAVAATRPRSRRRGRRIGVAVAIAVAVVAVTLVASWPSGGPNVVGRALAAIGTAPLVHAVVERSSPDNVVVDLKTGAVRERRHQIEYWYDRERSLLHTRVLTDGQMLTEIVETPTGSYSDLGHYPAGRFAAQLDPALAGFVTQYREALSSGVAKVIGETTIEGKKAVVLRIELGHGGVEDVAVDHDSYRPLLITYSQQGQKLTEWRVATVESIGRKPAFFAKPERSAPRPTGGLVREDGELTPAEASAAFRQPAVWLGTRFNGLSLARIERFKVETEYTDGSKHDGVKLQFTYGELTLGESDSVAGSYALGFNDGGDPAAPEGSIVLDSQRGFTVGSGRPVPRSGPWRGELVRDGLYIAIEAPSRQLVLDAARALERMP